MGSSLQSHPWPCLSTVNVANFVTVKPCLAVKGDENIDFEIWKEEILCLLESQDVVGFVNGEVLQPDPQNEDDTDHEQKAWRRTDRLVKGWILGSIGKDALHAVWEKKTARDVWLELDNIFNHQPQQKQRVKYTLPSTVNVGNFVTVKPSLKGDDRSRTFKIWKKQMLCLLESQDLVGFVDGSRILLRESDTKEKELWRRTDMLIQGWILGSIGEDALDAVWDKPTATEVWVELENIFNQQQQNSSGVEYPLPSTVNVANFLTVKPSLKGDERERKFQMWEQQMNLLLLSQDVVGFVNGTIPPPQNTDHKQSKAWRRTDWLVRGWILGSIGEDVLYDVFEKETAKDLWVELHNIFRDQEPQSNGYCSNLLTLYKAALRGDWETATEIFPDVNDLATTSISSYSDTALHIAVMSGEANAFVKNLVQYMPEYAVAIKDISGNTALHNAATIGNTEAVTVLVKKYPRSLRICNDNNNLPVMEAAISCKKDTLKLLISEHEKNAELYIFEGQQGIRLLNQIICSKYLDLALKLAENHPNLAILTANDGFSALTMLATMDTVFPMLETFSWWQWLIYHCIPLKKSTNEASVVAAADGAVQEQKKQFVIWTAIERLVPKGKMLRKKKLKHQQALELAKFLCEELVSSPEAEAQPSIIFPDAILMAVEYGITEIVEMIIRKYPEIIYYFDVNHMNVFQMAASYRFENIFNLIYNMSDRKYIFYNWSDNKNNNLMHVCGKLAPPERLNLVAGAALQMQRELQWFKEMQKYVHPSKSTCPNDEGQTPQMIFTEEHKNLKAEGEKWMKDTANACTIAAALIATVMFAAAFTVPGGLESASGIPLFSKLPAFNLFAVSDAISLFTSIFALLMFLSILTSRYAEEDFLYVLPKRLSIGLLSLFISITFMMVAFCATFYLVLHRDDSWYQLLLGAVACFPVTSFVLLQFPLLVDVVWSTYGPGIFGKKTNGLLY